MILAKTTNPIFNIYSHLDKQSYTCSKITLLDIMVTVVLILGEIVFYIFSTYVSQSIQ